MQRRSFKSVSIATLVVLAAVGTWFGCSPGSQSTAGLDDEVEYNAYEAELADELAFQAKAEKQGKEKAKDHGKDKKVVVAKKEEKKKVVASGDRQPASRGGVYVVQVGAFKNKENAEKLHEKLKAGGYNVEMMTMDHSKNGLLHLVRFPATENKAEASVLAETLLDKEELRAQVIKLPNEH